MSDNWRIRYSYQDNGNFSGTKTELFPGEGTAKARMQEIWREHVAPGFFQVRDIRIEKLMPAKLSNYVLHELPEDPWGEDPEHPASDWRYEVANGDTRYGYWDWLVEKTGVEVERPVWFEWVQVPVEWPGVPDWGKS